MYLPSSRCGRRGIRTLDTRKRMLVFKTSAFNHSSTHPYKIGYFLTKLCFKRKHKISPTRSYEGSCAFFISTFSVSILVLSIFYPEQTFLVFLVSALLGISGTLFDLVPLKIDDNLTIPLFIGASLWILTALFGIQ